MNDSTKKERATNSSLPSAIESIDRSLIERSDATPQERLERARALALISDMKGAGSILAAAVATFPDSIDLRLALAGVYLQSTRVPEAEKLLEGILMHSASHVGAGLLLARSLSRQGRFAAMAKTLRELFLHGRQDPDSVIEAVELLDAGNRQSDAAAICENEIAAGSTDPRIFAYAGMQHVQLGEFDLARVRYLYAVSHDKRALEWNIPVALSSLQRYADRNHPDFELFTNGLQQKALSDHAHASLGFALGKMHDDLADYENAALHFRAANSLVRSANPWSRKHWQRSIASRLLAKPRLGRQTHATAWAPLFIVGVPRSGTTLTTELLSRHPDVCNRGELGWLPKIAAQLELASSNSVAQLDHAASIYEAQLLQDDGTRAKWIIDKEPLNLLRVDLIMALYPNARIIFCQRNARDTALSLWSQYFTGGAQAYAYDLTDTAVVIQGCRRLMSHWLTQYGPSIYVVNYEELTSNPSSCIDQLALWLGLDEHDFINNEGSQTSISTGSLWQARQPVYRRSVERWRHYATFVPELLRIPLD